MVTYNGHSTTINNGFILATIHVQWSLMTPRTELNGPETSQQINNRIDPWTRILDPLVIWGNPTLTGNSILSHLIEHLKGIPW